MDKKVEIKKTVFNRAEYKDVIDRKFKFYKEDEPIIDPDTVEELFRLYDKLYMLIPIEGPNRTHQYLVEQSSELYNVDAQLENIQPLLDEVASLRRQILDGNRRVLELETQLAGGGQLNFEDAEQMSLLKTQLDTANNVISTLEQTNAIANMATQQSNQAANAAAEAAQNAAQNAANSSTSSGADTATVTEIVAMFNQKNNDLKVARYFIEKRKHNAIARYRNTSFHRYSGEYYWLFRTPTNRNGHYGQRDFYEPDSERDATNQTLDFIIDKLEQAGYTAREIVAAIEKIGNFKGRVGVRVITYKDEDKEDKTGYRLIK